MKLRFLFFIGTMLLIGSCRKGDVMNQLPSNILSKDQMISLLVDIHLTEASLKLNQTNIQPKEKKLHYSSAYLPVFKKHKTTPVQFDQSMQWYARHIEQLDEIYTEVITRLSQLETQLKVKPLKTPQKKITPPLTQVKKLSKLISPPKKK
jgi:hypothetical protein